MKYSFKPEFINRIDDIVLFNALDNNDMKQIITLLVNVLAGRCEKQFGIKLTVRPTVKQYIVDKYSDLEMDARPLKRAVQFEIEDA